MPRATSPSAGACRRPRFKARQHPALTSGSGAVAKNASLIRQAWQLEPSISFYCQISNDNMRNAHWAPGLRLRYRVRQEMSFESEVNVESRKTTSPTRNGSTTRTFYCFGGRYDF